MIKQEKKQLLYCQWTQQRQSVSVRGKTRTANFLQQTSTSIPDQLRFVMRGYRLWWILSGFWEENGILGGTQQLQNYQPSVSSDGRLFVHKPESPHTDDQNPGKPHYLNLDYELHQRTKQDNLFFESSKMLKGSEIQLFKNLCEQ